MKIIYRRGDLLSAPERYIAHGCNAHGRMRTGIAKTIREKYPAAFECYYRTYLHFGLSLGQVIPVDCVRHTVINCVTQKDSTTDRGFGEVYLDYDGLSVCMVAIEKFLNSPVPVPVAFPKIGAGEAGGDWSRIATILERSSVIQPIVYIYTQRDSPHD